MNLKATCTGTAYDKNIKIYAGKVQIGTLYLWMNSVVWEDYTDDQKEYNLCTVEDNGIIDNKIKLI